jgi:hypothetical protein
MAQTEAGYRGKWKKWLAIYLVAAAVVYLIVFLVFFNHGEAVAASATKRKSRSGATGRDTSSRPSLPGPSPGQAGCAGALASPGRSS